MFSTSEVDGACTNLIDMQVRRKFIIRIETGNILRVKALAARMCGFDAAAEEAAREKVWKRAGTLVQRALAEKPPLEADAEIVSAIAPELEMVRIMMLPLQLRRDEVETQMRLLASMLPVAPFLDEVAGFSTIGLAVIIGETGNLSNYASKQKLWRRLGYGMAAGHEEHAYSTWRMMKKLTAEDWVEAGYVPARLGQIYGVVTIPLLMAKTKNRYGVIYDNRRARTMITHPEWWQDKDGNVKLTKDGAPRSAHGMKDAARIMTKALLADLWRAWRGTSPYVSERTKHGLSPVPLSQDAA